MNILDEAISAPETERLRGYKIHFRQIGLGIGRAGMKDGEDVIPSLHRLKHLTFFTLDHGFYHPTLLHQGYCLVFLDVWEDEAAEYIGILNEMCHAVRALRLRCAPLRLSGFCIRSC